jgi:hypothetical protein
LTRNDIARSILSLITNSNISCRVIWIPKFLKINGNVKADELARSANAKHDIEETRLDFGDIKKLTKAKIIEKMEKDWNILRHAIFLGESKWKYFDKRNFDGLNKKEESVVTRILLGYSRYSHGHILEDCDPVQCDCGNPQDSYHIFDCFFNDNLRWNLHVNLHLYKYNEIDYFRELLLYLRVVRLYHLI